MNNDILRLANRLIEKDGVTNTYMENISFYKTSFYCPRVPILFDLRIVFVLQGRKDLFIDNRVLRYDKANYLVVPFSLPIDCETYATKDNPFISLRLDVDKKLMYEIVEIINQKKSNVSVTNSLGVFTDLMTDNLEDAISRLLSLLTKKEKQVYLINLLIKEILFYVASNENSYFLHKVFLSSNNEAKILRAIKDIQDNFNDEIDIQQLAYAEDMSISSFYTHFKEITSYTPLQYIKNLRLTKSQDLLNQRDYKIGEIANLIGYSNISQFSKDYKKYFGVSPKKSFNN